MKNAWVVVGLVLASVAFAEEVPTDVPVWLEMVLNFVQSVPVVGPLVVEVLKWLGVVSAVATALSTGLLVVAKALQALGQGLGFVTLAEKVDALYRKVWPYLAWLSVYNAKKKQ